MFSQSKITDGIRLMNVDTGSVYLESVLGNKKTPTLGVRYDVLEEMSPLYRMFRRLDGRADAPLSIPVRFARTDVVEGFDRNPVYFGFVQGFHGPESPEYDDVFVPSNILKNYEIGCNLFVQATLPDVSSILLRPWR